MDVDYDMVKEVDIDTDDWHVLALTLTLTSTVVGGDTAIDRATYVDHRLCFDVRR